MHHTARVALLLPLVSLAACDRAAPPPPGASAKAPPHTHAPSAPAPANVVPNTPPPAVPAPAATPDLADITAPTFVVGGVRFSTPEGWKRTAPSNQMRLAELRIPAPGGETADDCVAAFTQAGGSVDLNISRWKTQVLTDGKPTDGTTTTTEVGGFKTTVFTATGVYQDGMPGGSKTPRTQWTLRAAIIETPGYLTFVKMTGPAEPMTASTAAWDTLLKTAVKTN